jgi:PAS domain S-box-containing protein
MTEREQEKEQLQFQATILRNVTDGVIVTDLHGSITYWNEGASAVFGYSAQEMIGISISALFPGLDLKQFERDLQRILAGIDYVGEWKGRRKDGAVVWVDNKVTVLHDSPGAAIGFIGIAKDITARKQLEQEIVRTKEQLEIILHNVADSIIMVDANDQLVYANDVAARKTEFSSSMAQLTVREASIGHQHDKFTVWDEWGQPLPTSKRPTSQALRGEQAKALVQYQDNDSGHVSWTLVRAYPIFDFQGQVQFVISVYTDLTEQKELEQRKDHFISMASHELKTPLTILSAYTQLLRERLEADGRQDVVLHLSKMDEQITNLTKLVVDLLDISRMQAGQLELSQETVDMEELVHEVVENLQPTTTHQLLIEGAAQRPIIADRDRLRQVLIILLTNAIKYSPQAETVIVKSACMNEELIVSVRDFGIGIARRHQQRLFERFYRVLSKKDQTYPGLGISLYIAHQIIQRHGGKMWVDSVEEKGSTFFFSLPIR